MRASLSVLMAITMAACGAGSFPSPDPGSAPGRGLFEALEDSLRQAMLRQDTIVLGRLWAPEYLSTSAVGHTSTRAEALLAYGAGLVRVDSAQLSDLDVRVYDRLGVVLGLMRWGGEAAGRPFAGTVRFQHVWVSQPDRTWQLVASQLTSQPPMGVR